ncbi:hypothetical protein Dcar01_02191 [Deinococcus carri]|uniref:DUF2721 domain-containing protein n=1 Tax=Deinococcus carri TaxID=1211323 RepID=A0ABP9W8X8_9DEIO
MADPNLSVLTAMITPAVLISGAGTLLMSTSTRLGRATDRVRHLTARFKVLVSEEGRQEALARQEKQMIIRQLPRLTRRSRMLQRAMTSLYLAVALLVLTSILIGASSLLERPPGPAPVILALLGAAALAYAALLLSYETRLSARTTQEEMGFLVQIGQHYAELYGEGEDRPSGRLRHET